jgi:ATP-dependent Lon protease
MIPKRNEADLDDVPAEVLEKLEVHTVSDVRQVLELALEPAVRESALQGSRGPAAA